MKIKITKDLDEKKKRKKRKKRRKKRTPRAAYWWGYGGDYGDYGDAGGDGGGGGDGKRDDELKEEDDEVKKDACYYKVKNNSEKWPSAYASGRLVQCRDKGAANWNTGKSKKNESINEEFKPHKMYDPKTGDIVMANKEEDHHKLAKKGFTHVDPKELEKVLRDEGGASGMDPFLKAIGEEMEEEIIKTLKAMPNVGQHKDKDYILDDSEEIEVKKERKESSKDAGNLRSWFGRKGEKGSKGGWVDCNAPDGKGGYKECAQGDRKKYPACRPTPSACKDKGKGKSWGKEASKKNESLEDMINEEVRNIIFQEGLLEHVKTQTPLHKNIYRVGSECYFNTIKQGREFYKIGLYEAIDEEERDMLENTDLGEWVDVEGEKIPLDFPMYNETIDEEKDPPIGKPMKNSDGGKKYKVYVRNPKTGNIKKITYGDSKGGLKGNWNNAEARESFAARHNCEDKEDRTKAGYWACRAHKDFGTNVPGRFW